MGRFLLACCAVVARRRVLVLVAAERRADRRLRGPTRSPGFQPDPGRRARAGARSRSRSASPPGAPLTDYKRGAGPHTGVHLIVVRRDLGVIIHRHPPIGRERAHLARRSTSPRPGRTACWSTPTRARRARRATSSSTPTSASRARYRPQPLPPFAARQTVDGYTVTLRAPKQLHAIEAATLTAKVTDPSGKPVVFHPWFGALAHAIFFRAGLARLLPHPRLRALDARLHERARRREGDRPPGRAGAS